MASQPESIDQLLQASARGDREAFDRLVPLVYRELHKLAKHYMAQQSPGHTLQTTAVIHEAYLRMAGSSERTWESRTHFFAVAAKAMRHAIVDHARGKRSAKRGGEGTVLRLDHELDIANHRSEELIALDDALTALAKLNSRQSEVVELRYFAGLSVEETASVLQVSADTVMRDWKVARVFLHREIRKGTKA